MKDLKSNKKPKILIISGPTAIGKSAVAVEIAKKYQGEIISADSMQIYKRLDIGTGKINSSQMQGIEHYLIDIREPDQEYSVSEFVQDCKEKIDIITNKNKLPIIVGGTGLYINALLNGYNFAEIQKSDELRNELSALSSDALYDRLCKVDSESAKKININDKKRVIRALEIFYLSGKPKSQTTQAKTESEFDYRFFILDDERARIYSRINNRVEQMFEQGLVSEVEGLLEYKDCQSMQAIGYKEVIEYLSSDNKKIEDAIDRVKQSSRRYAKRQLTYLRWMNAEKVVIRLDDIDKIYHKIEDFV